LGCIVAAASGITMVVESRKIKKIEGSLSPESPE
jgi:hypothetical protein